MKLRSQRVIGWYSATLGVAAGAVISVYFDIGPVIMGALVFALVSYYSLAAVLKTDEENSPYHRISEYVAATGMVVFLPLIFLADFLTALVIFIGFAQLALNLQTHDYRRFYMGILVSFVGLCVGATESKSGFYLLFFLMYTICAGMAMGYAYMAQRQDAKVLQWDRIDRARVSVLMIALALIVYLLLPRMPAGGLLAQPGSDHFYHKKKWETEAKQNRGKGALEQLDGLWEEQRDYQEADNFDLSNESPFTEDGQGAEKGQPGDFDYRGFDNEFDIRNPDASGHRFSNRIVARMRAENAQYLRARIFDLFNGLQWQSSSHATVKLEVGFDGVELIPSDSLTSSRLQTYEIFIEHNIGDYIPAAAVPVALKFPASAIGVDIFGQIRSPGALKKGTAYVVTSQYNLIEGRLFAELDHAPLPSYTQLPRETDPRIKALAGSVINGAVTQLDGAIALEHHLRTQYQYDMDTAMESQNTTRLGEFLFETKRGHCEYFASALAVMLRTQDIPSRLVTGFSATNRNPLTGYYDIYALDGHAWVEAFVDDQGWVILEPTAYYDGPQPEEDNISAQQINDYVERQIKQRKILGRDAFSFAAMINGIWQFCYVMVSAGLAYVKLLMVTCWPWLVTALCFGGGSWVAWRRYRNRWLAYRICRKVTAYPADKPHQAVGFYLHAIEELLRLAGFQVPPGFTIERYLKQAASLGEFEGDAEMAAEFNRIHYNKGQGAPEIMLRYKQLFQRLYAIGLDGMRSHLRNR